MSEERQLDVLEQIIRNLVDENKELKEKHDHTQWLVNQILFDKGAFPFICGTMGESDKNGMFDYFRICPAYGSDATYTYKKVTDNGN
jgi:hypothetical protein